MNSIHQSSSTFILPVIQVMNIGVNPRCEHVPVTFTTGPNGWSEDAFVIDSNTDTNDLDVVVSSG